MPGDPEECRRNALRCSRLAKRAKQAETRQAFAAMSEVWMKLAAELESDAALLRAISEMQISEPYDSLPQALKLRS